MKTWKDVWQLLTEIGTRKKPIRPFVWFSQLVVVFVAAFAVFQMHGALPESVKSDPLILAFVTITICVAFLIASFIAFGLCQYSLHKNR